MTMMPPDGLIDLDRYPIHELAQSRTRDLVEDCRAQLSETGACVLENFLVGERIKPLLAEIEGHLSEAFYAKKRHNAYLIGDDSSFPPDHPRNRPLTTSSATLAYDLIPKDCLLDRIYHWDPLRAFIAKVLRFDRLFPYADPLGALNVLVYRDGCETGWHFDNANFVVTLLLQPAERGGLYQYVPFIRNAHEENFDHVARVLDGEPTGVMELKQGPGALVLFQGRFTLHRVTAVSGQKPRLISVFSYDREPGKMLTEHTCRTFYGRAN